MDVDIRIRSLQSINDTQQQSAAYESSLHVLGARAQCAAAFHDYALLYESCETALSPILQQLKVLSYRPWLFLAGASMTTQKRATYPHYDLSKPAKEIGLLTQPSLERDFAHDGSIRACGLYAVQPHHLHKLLLFAGASFWSLSILSNRSDFLAEPGLQAVLDAAGYDDDGKPQHTINFLAAAALLCPLGDVVVKTEGSHDDKYRGIHLLYDPQSPIKAMMSVTKGYRS